MLILPPIADYGVQRGLLARGMKKKRGKYLEFRKTVPIGVFDENVWVTAAHIYAALCRQGNRIEDADIFVAAFCLVNGHTLVTDNTRHFENIEGLKFVIWKEHSSE